ncbi:arginase family protein [Serinicoccus kebangsaanensis]|uniref:arginase family protein n=1 Tax=Serinicoccus kebangsaanensis TaxID=2602069 RepID=UPI00124E57BA|nr:arginase family protein [Serinicoccus kebangsaanensis]
MSRRVHVVGAATSAGAHGPGQELAPAALREAGLLRRLQDRGLEVVEHGDVVQLRMRPDDEHPALRSAARVVAAATTVADHVERLLTESAEDRILVLGGDCTIQLGVVAGARAARGDRVGLAYVDLDCDLTSPVEGNGFADWMGVTHLVGAPDADPRLAGLGGPPPMVTPDTLRLVGADLATPYEQRRLADLALTRYTTEEITTDTAGVVAELTAWADDLDLLSVHVDVDVLDQRLFPVAEEQRDTPGLGLETLGVLTAGLMGHPAARVLTVCEVNPARPPDPGTALASLNDLLAGAMTAPPAGRRD